MPEFVTQSETTRPPEETFDFIVDLSQWPSFRGYGPLPGIVKATLSEPVSETGGAGPGLGSRIRVENTDGSVHHEVVVAFERGRLLQIRMELAPPVSYVLASIDETVELEPTPTGTRVTRRFVVQAASVFSAPVAWLFGGVLLRRAVDAHNVAVSAQLARRGSGVDGTRQALAGRSSEA
jgi:hypothetical protein